MQQTIPAIFAMAVLLFGQGAPVHAGLVDGGTYPAGTSPQSIATGDFNGDGTPDLAVADVATNSVLVLLGNGDGTFQASVGYPAGGGPRGVSVGDFNGDHRPDLAVASSTSSEVSILLGNGNGTFQAPVGYPVGAAPVAVAVGDLDRDGRLDVAVASMSSNDVSILLGNGNGTLQAAVPYGVGTSPTSLAVSDFNGDGRPDLVVANRFSQDVSILLGNGNGTFQAAVSYGGFVPRSVAVADFNRDGKPDLAVAQGEVGGPNLFILLGIGDGTFQDAVGFASGTGASSVVVGDFDGDGRPDIALAKVAISQLSILRGRGDGSFEAAGFYSLSPHPESLAADDFDGDGQLDVASVSSVGGGSVDVFLNDAVGAVCAAGVAVSYTTGAGPYAAKVADFNRDGVPDLVVPNGADGTVSILLGNGNGSFQGKMDYPVSTGPFHAPVAVAVGDFNRDGKPDVAVANLHAGALAILLGNGDGTLRTPVEYPAGAPNGVVAGDFNGDGKLDLVATSILFGGGYFIRLGNGDGTFMSDQGFLGGFPMAPVQSAVADFNGDGKLDWAIAATGSTDVSVRLGTGDGGFLPPVGYPAGGRPISVAVGDFNRDGHPDLAVVTSDSNNAMMLLNNGNGTFAAAVPYAAGTHPSRVAVGDFNRDGRIDLAVASLNSSDVSVLSGVGDGSFETAVNYPLPSPGPTAVVVGDFNRDGTPDLVASGNASPTVSILLGTCRFPTSTTVPSSSVNPSFPSQTVTFTATVASSYGVPTGAVTFKDGPTALGTIAFSGGAARLTTSALASGSHTITAEYAGAATFFPSTSGPLTHVVNDLAFTVDDLRIAEGNSGTSPAVFVVRLSPAAGTTVTVGYETVEGSATASLDFMPASGTLTFLPGETEHEVSVTVLGDVTPEPNEAFFLRVLDPGSQAPVGRTAQATIVDDDVAGGASHHQALWQPFFAVNTLETPYVGDFDGDGKTDIITFTRQNPLAFGDVYVAFSNGTQFGSSVKWNDFFAINTSEQVVIGDFDGDGKDDIATWLSDTSRQVYVALSFGTAGMGESKVWETSIGFAPSDVLTAGDVNGDGLADLVLFARTQGKVYVGLSNGVSFGPPTQWHSFFAVSTDERPAVADLNGDGRADIVTFATDSPTAFGDVYVALSDGTRFGDGQNSDKWQDFFAIRQTEIVRIGDLNGDGKDDFFTFLPPPFAQCYTSLSTGTSMGPSVLWPEPVSPDARDKTFVGDANGDGHADIITFAQGEGRVYVSLAP